MKRFNGVYPEIQRKPSFLVASTSVEGFRPTLPSTTLGTGKCRLPDKGFVPDTEVSATKEEKPKRKNQKGGAI